MKRTALDTPSGFREKMARIMVAPTLGSKRRITWAAFRSNYTAQHYMDQLQKENPSWVIEFRRGTIA